MTSHVHAGARGGAGARARGVVGGGVEGGVFSQEAQLRPGRLVGAPLGGQRPREAVSVQVQRGHVGEPAALPPGPRQRALQLVVVQRPARRPARPHALSAAHAGGGATQGSAAVKGTRSITVTLLQLDVSVMRIGWNAPWTHRLCWADADAMPVKLKVNLCTRMGAPGLVHDR